MLLFLVIACVVLAAIFVQDVATRSIWWFLPPVLFGVFIAFRWKAITLTGLGFNIAFILLLMVFLTLYIRLRFGKLENPFTAYFGLGDFLFILALTPLLAFREFVLFFTIGTFLTLLLHGIALLFRKQATIPYAGYFSLVTIAYLLLVYSGVPVFSFIQP